MLNQLTNIIGNITLYVAIGFAISKMFSIINFKVLSYLQKRKSEKEKRNRLNSFYTKIKLNHKELKPFLISLNQMINEIMSQDLTQAELNRVLSGYHLYQDIFDRIVEGKGVEENDLIYFAELHVNYTDFVKNWKKMKKDEFYSKNKFFDISLN
jgi:hypothetical protein